MSENSFSKQGEETQNLVAFSDKESGGEDKGKAADALYLGFSKVSAHS